MEHYLDFACLGKPTRRTLHAVSRAMEELAALESPGTPETLRFFDACEQARQRAAQLVHADVSQLVLVDSTTHGLGLVANALPLRPGENVLIDDLEFLGAAVVWRAVSQRAGVEIRPVKTAGGRALPEDFARSADGRTRAIVLSSVQEVSGFRADLKAMREVARSFGAWLIVDGIQEAGAVPVNLEAAPVDAYCAGGHKWLRSPFGLGFMCIHPELLARMQPATQGYLALAEPAGGWEPYLQSPERTPFDPLEELDDARRLQPGGTPNWIGAVALREAIAELMETGAGTVWTRICSLTDRLRAGLRKMGLKIWGDAEGGAAQARAHHSGVVCFALPGGVAAERELLARLSHAGIYVSLRHVSGIGGIRVSPHHDSSMGGIDRLLEVTAAFVSARR